jgi:hypothetical protein
MKVGGSSGVGSAQAAQPRNASQAAGGFALGGAGAAAEAAPSTRLGAALGVGSLDALLALQEVGGPLERRKKAVRRASVILDVLDDVKLALIDGGVPPAALGRLIEAVRNERAATGDPKLESLLDEIETRAAVELAKLEQHAAAA